MVHRSVPTYILENEEKDQNLPILAEEHGTPADCVRSLTQGYPIRTYGLRASCVNTYVPQCLLRFCYQSRRKLLNEKVGVEVMLGSSSIYLITRWWS